jgi:hypothetical protein
MSSSVFIERISNSVARMPCSGKRGFLSWSNLRFSCAVSVGLRPILSQNFLMTRTHGEASRPACDPGAEPVAGASVIDCCYLARIPF